MSHLFTCFLFNFWSTAWHHGLIQLQLQPGNAPLEVCLSWATNGHVKQIWDAKCPCTRTKQNAWGIFNSTTMLFEASLLWYMLSGSFMDSWGIEFSCSQRNSSPRPLSWQQIQSMPGSNNLCKVSLTFAILKQLNNIQKWSIITDCPHFQLPCKVSCAGSCFESWRRLGASLASRGIHAWLCIKSKRTQTNDICICIL